MLANLGDQASLWTVCGQRSEAKRRFYLQSSSSRITISLRRFASTSMGIERCHFWTIPSMMAESVPKDKLGSRITSLDHVPELGQSTCRSEQADKGTKSTLRSQQCRQGSDLACCVQPLRRRGPQSLRP